MQGAIPGRCLIPREKFRAFSFRYPEGLRFQTAGDDAFVGNSSLDSLNLQILRRGKIRVEGGCFDHAADAPALLLQPGRRAFPHKDSSPAWKGKVR